MKQEPARNPKTNTRKLTRKTFKTGEIKTLPEAGKKNLRGNNRTLIQTQQHQQPPNFKSSQTKLSKSQGLISIAKAIRNNSSTLSFVFSLRVSSLILDLLIPVFLEISALLADFFAKYNPSLVIIVFDYPHSNLDKTDFSLEFLYTCFELLPQYITFVQIKVP